MKAKVIVVLYGGLPESAHIIQGQSEEQIRQKLPNVLKNVYEDENRANGNISCSSEEFQRSVIENCSYVQGGSSNLEIYVVDADVF